MSLWVGTAVATLVAVVALAVLRSHRELGRWLGRDPHARRRAVRGLSYAVAAILVGIGLVLAAETPPRLSGAGADVVLAIDVSRSMDATDVGPSRLRRALYLGERLAAEASGIRIALVVFAGNAYVALPLTQDWDALLTYLGALDTAVMTDLGTDLARALDVAGGVFDPRSSRPRRILLFSDGEHGRGDIEGALGRLRSMSVEVVPVGFGTLEGSRLPGRGSGPLRAEDGTPVVSRRVDSMLRRVATATGGVYFRELEERPTAARLLPEPDAGEARSEESEPTPVSGWIELVVLLAGALVAADLVLSVGRVSLPGLVSRRVAPTAVAVAALTLVAPGGWSYQREGDAALAGGEPRKALSLYRKSERHYGSSPSVKIRIGNAYYRLDQTDKAASAFLAALREVGAPDSDARFVAAFNLGTALLASARFEEARDVLWGAMAERPGSLETKFNYEWALEHAEPEKDVPVPPVPQQSERESEQESGGAPQVRGQEQEPDRRHTQDLSESEAERWLRSIEEPLDRPLRQQIADAEQRTGARSRRGQTW
jgi:hypothetical protein